METILKDKNIIQLKNVIILSDKTPVAVYTKFDNSQNYVLIDDSEFGPFESTNLFVSTSYNHKSTVSNYYFAGKDFDGKVRCFCKKGELKQIPSEVLFDSFLYESKLESMFYRNNYSSQLMEQSEQLLNEISKGTKEFTNPYIKESEGYYYFEINNTKYGPFEQLWACEVLDEQHFQYVYISPFDNSKFHYVLNGELVASYPLNAPVYAPYGNSYFTESGKAIFQGLYDNYLFIDGKKVDFFNKKCSQISYFERNGHFLAKGVINRNGNQSLAQMYCYDNKIYKNWMDAFLLKDGTPVFTEVSVNEFTGHQELTWFCGNKQLSIPVHTNGYESLVSFGGSLIYYLRDGISYILMGGEEYQGFRVNDEYVSFIKDGEIILYKHEDEFTSDEVLAKYLVEKKMIAGLDIF